MNESLVTASGLREGNDDDVAEQRYDRGMTPEHFQTTIRAFHRRTPFKPYVVELVSGDRVRVDHPEALVLRGGVGVFVSASGEPAIFDHEGVSQIFGDSAETTAA